MKVAPAVVAVGSTGGCSVAAAVRACLMRRRWLAYFALIDGLSPASPMSDGP
jgi:hypothetical protein